MRELTDAKKSFMVGLEKLSRETGIVIWGCGCCNSPEMLEDADMSKLAGYGFGDNGQLKWITPADVYDWAHYSDTIIKPASGGFVRIEVPMHEEAFRASGGYRCREQMIPCDIEQETTPNGENGEAR